MQHAILRKLAIEAAESKAVNFGDRDLKLLIVWDGFGNCRAYATEATNLHWSVPNLNAIDTNYSLPV